MPVGDAAGAQLAVVWPSDELATLAISSLGGSTLSAVDIAGAVCR